jgi:hypothetical protein
MTVRYLLAPEAAVDLVQIWRYIKNQSSVAMADRVESVIRTESLSWRIVRVPAIGAGT